MSDIIGECQICAGEWKVVGGLIAYHGYRRPGVGFIIGPCPGSRYLPYEQSADRCVWYRDYVLGELEKFNAEHDRLKTRPPIEVHRSKRWPSDLRALSSGDPRDFDRITVGPDHKEYDRLLKTKLTDLMGHIRGAVSEVDRMTKRIDAWEPKPLRREAQVARARERKEKADRRGLSPKQFALMESTSRGIKATLCIPDLRAVLDALGWQLLDRAGAAVIAEGDAADKHLPLRDLGVNVFGAWDHPNSMQARFQQEGSDNEGAARAFEQALHVMVEADPSIHATEARGPADPVVGDRYLYVKGVLQPKHGKAHAREVIFRLWLGVPGWEAVAPDGSTVHFQARVHYRGVVEQATAVKTERFWKFAYKHGIQQAARDWLSSAASEVSQK